jgi:hypothetical protein
MVEGATESMSSVEISLSWTGKKCFFFGNLEEVSLICHKFSHNYIKI